MSNGTQTPPCTPIYLPFSAVQSPLTQFPSEFVNSGGYGRYWFPFARVAEAGWNEALHPVITLQPSKWSEAIDWPLKAGVQDQIVPFAVEKISPVILLNGAMIVNEVDPLPYANVSFIVTNLSTSLLAIQLNCLLDSGNYRFQALAMVIG